MDVRIEVAQREHLHVLQQRAATSTLVSSVGTTTIVRALSGTCSEKSRRDSRRGGIAQAISRWATAIAMSVAGMASSSAMIAAITRGETASCCA